MGAKDVKITLLVDAKKLSSIHNPTQEEIDACCEFKDDNHGKIPNGGKLQDFQSIVYLDKKVEWKGIDKDEPEDEKKGYDIGITKIDFKAGIQAFKKNPPFIGNGSRRSAIKEQLKKDVQYEGEIESYSIYFEISKDQTTWGPFGIDPKLKMHANRIPKF